MNLIVMYEFQFLIFATFAFFFERNNDMFTSYMVDRIFQKFLYNYILRIGIYF